ncbi:MAG TPA: peptidylprolyl isomerase [Sulfuricella sp.]|nr:peptidylprolyl isomerase [Sulfuricella sp.]
MAEQKIGSNKTVHVTYTILDGRGNVFEQYDMPIGYVHGANSGLFEKIEAALEGRVAGDRVEVTLNPEEGFGPHYADLTFTDDVDNVPPEFRRIGAEVEFENDKGETMKFFVTKIENGKLTVDSNHPMAGQTVTFIVNVVSVKDATREEIAKGRPDDESMPSLH